MQGKGAEKLRVNPRKAWYANLVEVKANGDSEATFVLKRPQPAFIALLASGMSPIYPCHVTPAQMRQHPIGTGPFKFVEFKPNKSVKVVRNPDYWRPGLPYLDGIEYKIVRNRSTAILAFIAGNYDLTFAGSVTVPLMHDIQSQRAPGDLRVAGRERQHQPHRQSLEAALRQSRTAPGDGADDRPQIVYRHPDPRHRAARRRDAAAGRQGGIWGMPKEMLAKLPGYDPDVKRTAPRRAQSWKNSATGRTSASR